MNKFYMLSDQSNLEGLKLAVVVMDVFNGKSVVF